MAIILIRQRILTLFLVETQLASTLPESDEEAMHFTIDLSGCGENKGLVEIRYNCYLDPGDYGYNIHYIQIPDVPSEGYPKQAELDAVRDAWMTFAKTLTKIPPLEERQTIPEYAAFVQADEERQAWLDALPKKWQNNPFCCHFRQYEADVTDTEIMVNGPDILYMAYQNWMQNDLSANENPYMDLVNTQVYHQIIKPFTKGLTAMEKQGKPLDFPTGEDNAMFLLAESIMPGFTEDPRIRIKLVYDKNRVRASEQRVDAFIKQHGGQQ